MLLKLNNNQTDFTTAFNSNVDDLNYLDILSIDTLKTTDTKLVTKPFFLKEEEIPELEIDITSGDKIYFDTQSKTLNKASGVIIYKVNSDNKLIDLRNNLIFTSTTSANTTEITKELTNLKQEIDNIKKQETLPNTNSNPSSGNVEKYFAGFEDYQFEDDFNKIELTDEDTLNYFKIISLKIEYKADSSGSNYYYYNVNCQLIDKFQDSILETYNSSIYYYHNKKDELKNNLKLVYNFVSGNFEIKQVNNLEELTYHIVLAEIIDVENYFEDLQVPNNVKKYFKYLEQYKNSIVTINNVFTSNSYFNASINFYNNFDKKSYINNNTSIYYKSKVSYVYLNLFKREILVLSEEKEQDGLLLVYIITKDDNFYQNRRISVQTMFNKKENLKKHRDFLKNRDDKIDNLNKNFFYKVDLYSDSNSYIRVYFNTTSYSLYTNNATLYLNKNTYQLESKNSETFEETDTLIPILKLKKNSDYNYDIVDHIKNYEGLLVSYKDILCI